jgi:transposase
MKVKDMYYIGLDIHKKNHHFCIKKADGEPVDSGTIPSTKTALIAWASQIDRPWKGAMEATLFTGWVYDTLKPFAQELVVGNPLRLKAITTAKNKNDRIDAATLADLLRVNLIPRCYIAPPEMRDLRRVLRYRNYLVRSATRMKNKTAGLLMECGVEYNKKKLHHKGYFHDLLGHLEEVPESVIEMLRYNRGMMETFEKIQKRLIRALKNQTLLKERVELLQTIPGVGEILALTWALEIVDPHRFRSIRRAISYCGLCSGEHSSGEKSMRRPISKQRNKNLQWALIEVAKAAPRHSSHFAEIYAQELEKSNANQATLKVARKMVAYLLAIDKSGKAFEEREKK